MDGFETPHKRRRVEYQEKCLYEEQIKAFRRNLDEAPRTKTKSTSTAEPRYYPLPPPHALQYSPSFHKPSPFSSPPRQHHYSYPISPPPPPSYHSYDHSHQNPYGHQFSQSYPRPETSFISTPSLPCFPPKSPPKMDQPKTKTKPKPTSKPTSKTKHNNEFPEPLKPPKSTSKSTSKSTNATSTASTKPQKVDKPASQDKPPIKRDIPPIKQDIKPTSKTKTKTTETKTAPPPAPLPSKPPPSLPSSSAPSKAPQLTQKLDPAFLFSELACLGCKCNSSQGMLCSTLTGCSCYWVETECSKFCLCKSGPRCIRVALRKAATEHFPTTIFQKARGFTGVRALAFIPAYSLIFCEDQINLMNNTPNGKAYTLVDHSSTPNATRESWFDTYGQYVGIFSNKDIQPGDEITVGLANNSKQKT